MGYDDRLKEKNYENTGCYSKAIVRENSTEIVELDNNGFLAVYQPEGHWNEFALFTYSYGDGHESEQSNYYEIVFHGCGTGGDEDQLREFRHSYWGDGGYLHYAPIPLIIAALKALEKWYNWYA